MTDQELSPSDELMLAQLLDAWLEAESQDPAASAALLANAPADARAELEQLTGLAASLHAAADVAVPSAEARAAVWARVSAGMQQERQPISLADVRARRNQAVVWIGRIAAGFIALSVASFATVTASANSLPGDALYTVKQTTEAIELQLAPTETARADVLMRQADTRLAETIRVLETRPDEVEQLAARYDQAIEQATQAVLSAEPEEAAPDSALTQKLAKHQETLVAVRRSAPAATAPAIERALEVSDKQLTKAQAAQDAKEERQAERAAQREAERAARAAAPSPTPRATATPRATPTPRVRPQSPTATVPSRPGGNPATREPDDSTPNPRNRTPEAKPTAPSAKPSPTARPQRELRGQPGGTRDGTGSGGGSEDGNDQNDADADSTDDSNTTAARPRLTATPRASATPRSTATPRATPTARPTVAAKPTVERDVRPTRTPVQADKRNATPTAAPARQQAPATPEPRGSGPVGQPTASAKPSSTSR